MAESPAHGAPDDGEEARAQDRPGLKAVEPAEEAEGEAGAGSTAAATAAAAGKVAMDVAAEAGRSLVGIANDLARSRRWMVRDTPNLDKLRTDLTRFAGELPGLVERGGDRAERWAPTAERLATDAAHALGRGSNLEAWSLLWASQREAIDGLRPEEVRAGAVETLDTARGLLEEGAVEVVEKEVEPVAEAKPAEARSHLREARLLVDRLVLDVYRRLHQEARRVSAFAMLLVAFLVAGALATFAGVPNGGDGDALSGAGPYLTVVAFGAAGALLSLILPWREKVARPALLDFVNPVDLMILRIATGSACALIVVAVLQADVQAVLDLSSTQAYPWALAAGFSERLVDRRLAVLDAEARDLDSH